MAVVVARDVDRRGCNLSSLSKGKRMRSAITLGVVALLAFAGAAQAQGVVTRDCTKGCTIISDPYPATATQPTSCILVGAGAPISRPALDGTAILPPQAPGATCHFANIALLPGAYSLTAIGVGADGRQSNPSLPLSVTAIGPPPGTPQGLRFLGP
jgi:hypothetical protein